MKIQYEYKNRGNTFNWYQSRRFSQTVEKKNLIYLENYLMQGNYYEKKDFDIGIIA